MIQIFKARLFQKHRTSKYPRIQPEMADRYSGKPILKSELCDHGCNKCIEVCPVGALQRKNGKIALDMGLCLFCNKCASACTNKKSITFSRDYRLSSFSREALVLADENLDEAIDHTKKEIKRLFGRSLKLRQVSAGGCNACELDTNVLNTLVFDLSRFGISFVASPKHADGLIVTGPVTKNMHLALQKTYDAIPDPKVVIAVGACSISGGLYRDNEECGKGVTDILPVDVYIPGCPPSPWTILDGLLRLIDYQDSI